MRKICCFRWTSKRPKVFRFRGTLPFELLTRGSAFILARMDPGWIVIAGGPKYWARVGVFGEGAAIPSYPHQLRGLGDRCIPSMDSLFLYLVNVAFFCLTLQHIHTPDSDYVASQYFIRSPFLMQTSNTAQASLQLKIFSSNWLSVAYIWDSFSSMWASFSQSSFQRWPSDIISFSRIWLVCFSRKIWHLVSTIIFKYFCENELTKLCAVYTERQYR